MQTPPDENNLEKMLSAIPPAPGPRLTQRLASAPWTPRAVRRRVLSVTVLALLALSASLLATPQGQAFAQSLLRFFARAEGDLIQAPAIDSPLVSVTPGAAATPIPLLAGGSAAQAGCGSLLAPRCTLAEVRRQVNFPVKEIPAGTPELAFVGAIPHQNGAVLAYEGNGVLYLAQMPAQEDDPGQWQVGQSAVVEAVSIGDLRGEYVQGGWSGLELSEEGELGWEGSMAFGQTLRWEENNVQFTLWYHPQKRSNDRAFDKARLIEIAANLAALPEASLEAAPTPEMTVAQAAALAGFTPVEPAELPAGFSFIKSAYASQWNAVCLYYRAQPDERFPALVIAQSNWAPPTWKELQTEATYNGTPVEIVATIESVPLDPALGGAATLVTTGLEASHLCGGAQTPANRALLWQAGGKSFVIFALLDQFDGRGFLTRLEMRRLAEQLSGTIPSSISLDPERLNSVQSAEQFSGLAIQAPSLMLASLYLDHVALGNEGPYQVEGGQGPIALVYTGQPLGDGRRYKVLILQIPGSTNSLENLALAGGYEHATVNEQAAIYREICWEEALPENRTNCRQELIWFDGGTEFTIETLLSGTLPKDLLIAIAESMQ